MTPKRIKMWYWIVNRLPVKVVYFCFMRVMVYATTGKYSGVVVPNLKAMDAIKVFGDEYVE